MLRDLANAKKMNEVITEILVFIFPSLSVHSYSDLRGTNLS